MMSKRKLNSEISTDLNSIISNIKFHFSEKKLQSILKINNFSPIFFDNSAGGKVVNGSYHWLKNKHQNGFIHEPATIAAFLFIQNYFANQIQVIFDIGALYGYFSLISKSMFPESTLFSFEMNPDSYIALCKNINVNKHLGIPASRCINIGLSDQTSLQKRVFIDTFILKEDSEDEKSSIVDILSLDDFCRLSGFQPDLIKLDVEGYQAKILPGSMNTIGEAKPIIILEFDGQKQLSTFSTTNKQITKPLFDLGYSCYWCKEQRNFQGKFQALNYDDFSQEHEINSLAIFIPN